jgi:FkbM family methyltransferase
VLQRQNDLIYDVGMHDGSDTAYYLHQGFRVVAIDADPASVEDARQRFAGEIASGRLTVLNLGIAAEQGSATFWICDNKKIWNSFDRTMASRDGHPHHAIEIPTMPFRAVLEQYGVPYFLKIDIEGHDHYCVADLEGAECPAYISMEAEVDSPDGGLTLLEKTGYRRFKLIRQSGWWAGRGRLGETIHRLMTSAAYGRLRPLQLGWLTRRFSDQFRIESLGYDFIGGSSGPWGETATGKWMRPAKALATLQAERDRVVRLGIDPVLMWWDWHATF